MERRGERRRRKDGGSEAGAKEVKRKGVRWKRRGNGKIGGKSE